MINEENIQEWLSRFYAGQLTEEETTRLQEVLDRIFRESRYRELDKELEEFLGDPDLIRFREIVQKSANTPIVRRRPNVFLMAALLTVMITLGSFLLYRYPVISIHPVGFTTLYLMKKIKSPFAPSTPATTHSQRIWKSGLPSLATVVSTHEPNEDRFFPLVYLESLVGIVMRSASCHLLTPGDSLFLNPGNPIHFIWIRNEGAVYSVEILTNRGEVKWERVNMREDELIVSTLGWAEGLYYWRISHPGGVVGVGKIILRADD